MNSHLYDLIETGLINQASDLHLSSGSQPFYRMNGLLRQWDKPLLNDEMILQAIKNTAHPLIYETFLQQADIDYAFEINIQDRRVRLRANAYRQVRGLSLALRYIDLRIKNLSELGLPQSIKELCTSTSGLILIVGATGSGKSTTLAAMINHINTHYHKHIITMEDPIECIYENKYSLIDQREIKHTAVGFESMLRVTLRQDPDVIVIGELRDIESIRIALQAAETGHLVFATLHATSAIKAIDRMIHVFSGDEQTFIRTLIANTLKAIIAQELILNPIQTRTAIYEIMIVTTGISHLIRENKTNQLISVIQTSEHLGMQTREQHVERLKASGQLLHSSR
jgi:twitching motility protein PilT